MAMNEKILEIPGDKAASERARHDIAAFPKTPAAGGEAKFPVIIAGFLVRGVRGNFPEKNRFYVLF
jgi:hypothetical protein